jgi:hypothetical protein
MGPTDPTSLETTVDKFLEAMTEGDASRRTRLLERT